MHTLKIIDSLKATTSRIEKEQILLEGFLTGNREFFRGALLAYDPLVTFGVQKVAEITEDDGAEGEFTIEDFLVLAHKLRKRELTGHAARDAIHEAAAACNFRMWNDFYRRVLLKDLKCGIEDKPINKILNKIAQAHPEAREYLIPIFDCQLAHDGQNEQHAKKLKGTKMLDIKLDGVRLLTILDKEMNSVTQYTRNGKINENFPHIREGLAKIIPELPGSVVLDGEIVAATFQELMTQINRKTDKNSQSAKLALFDIIPLADFRAGICHTTQQDRHEVLSSLTTSGILTRATNDAVYTLPKITIDLDTEEGQKQFKEFNAAAILAKKEGIMAKDPLAPYECKRSAAWLKIKPFIEVSLTIVGVEEGKPDGKYVGTMGAIVCEGEDDGKKIVVNVGSGFSDEDRDYFWARRDDLIGFVVEIQADAFSQNRTTDEVWSLRFPRWKGFRGTKPGEKL